jgi:pyruvate formate lyase activating enzyme
MDMRKAMLWKQLPAGKVLCELCSHFCLIAPGGRGKCAVRVNKEGVLHTLTYERVAAMGLDPVEKKPLYHFMPGTRTFSLGTMGCNLFCGFCQNYSLSQPPRQNRPVIGQPVTPRILVDAAIGQKAASISYTYSEPTIFFELMLDTAKLAVEQGLKNIIVSNGFMTKQCLDELAPFIHAANIDLKAFTEEFYERVCGGRLEPVLNNLLHIRELGWWLEVTTLVIPGENDTDSELERMALFIREELGAGTPWHLSRFHPDFQMLDTPSTPTETIQRACDLGRRTGLKYVYPGNVAGIEESTRCPECGTVCIDRRGHAVKNCSIREGKCPGCGMEIEGYGFEEEVSIG